MHRSRIVPGAAVALLVVWSVLYLGLASAQYPGSYSSYKKSAPKGPGGPNLAGGLSTYGGNPYKSQYYPPTGMATGAKYGFSSAPKSNPFAHQPVQKPFSSFQRPQPLMSSMGAARLEVARGLWYH